MSLTTLRAFYRKNNVHPDLLYKEDYNYANKIYINCDEDPVYLNGKIGDDLSLLEASEEHKEMLRKFRKSN